MDPSHATGRAEMVPGAGRAAIACGAHGLIVEITAEGTPREDILCDATQAIRPTALGTLVRDAHRIAAGEPVEAAVP